MAIADHAAPPPVPLSGALVGGGFFTVAAVLGRMTVLDGQSLSLVWPAAGVLLVWFLLRDARALSIDTAVLVVAAMLANLATGATVGLAIVLTVVNVAQVLLHVGLLRRFSPALGSTRPHLSGLGDLGTLVWTGTVAATVAVALGGLGLAAVTDVPPTTTELAVWWGRLLGGALVVGSVGILSSYRWLTGLASPLAGLAHRRLEALALAVMTAVGLAAVFTTELPLAFTLLALSVWTAKRFSTLVSAWHSLICATVAVLFTLAEDGPFSLIVDDRLAALTVQGYVTMLSLLGLFVAVSRDEREHLITSLADAHEDSRLQAQLLSTIVDSMEEGVTAVDAEGGVLIQNPAAQRMLEIDGLRNTDQLAPRALGKDGLPVPEEQRPSVRALKGELVQEDLLFRRLDGSVRHIAVSAMPLSTSRPDVPGAVMVWRDVTSEVEQQADLKAFAGTVAHDIHNPLAAIVGWNQIMLSQLESGEWDEQELHGLGVRLGRSADRLHELVQGLLEHASSKDRQLDLTRVDLGVLLGRITESRGVEGQVRWDVLPSVRADHLLAGQLLDNLVGNALKYVAPGVTPDVVVTATTERPDWVTVRIADNGIGIPDGEYDAVFDEFRRVHPGYQGTGLGLSIVKRIVTRHDGTIAAMPNPSGSGTVFEFTLPAG